LKKAIGSCLGRFVFDENAEMPGDGDGEGAENKSKGRPEDVTAALDEEATAGDESVGRERPPFPDRGVSSASSAKASKEMRSAAFWFGFALRDQRSPILRLTSRSELALLSTPQLCTPQTVPGRY